MKSLYYTALVTRAYRKRIDETERRISAAEAAPFVAELYNAAHREFATGFYFSKDDANKTTVGETKSPYLLAGTIGNEVTLAINGAPQIQQPEGFRDFEFVSMNKIDADMPLEYVGPDLCAIEDTDYTLIDPETGAARDWVCHGHPCVLRTAKPVQSRFIVRVRDPEFSESGTEAVGGSPDAPPVDRTPKAMRRETL